MAQKKVGSPISKNVARNPKGMTGGPRPSMPKGDPVRRGVEKRKNDVMTGRISLKDYLGGDRPKRTSRGGSGSKIAQ